jgi:hypothetical protein
MSKDIELDFSGELRGFGPSKRGLEFGKPLSLNPVEDWPI